MGLPFSGETADSAYYSIVEKYKVGKTAFRQFYGIKYYGRFKDDIFMILERRGVRTTDLWKVMRDRSSFYTHKLEGTSTTGVSFLDTFVHKGSGWRKSGRLDYRPHFKSTSLSIPLSFSSAHPVS
eukprot:2977578-Pyramimonas_sp.AAC.1